MAMIITLFDLYKQDVADDTIFINHMPTTNAIGCANVHPMFHNKTKFTLHENVKPVDEKEMFLELPIQQNLLILGSKQKTFPIISVPVELLCHWESVLQQQVDWSVGDIHAGSKCHVMFPLENLPPEQHVVPPDIHYKVASKCFIPTIPCPQPEVLTQPEYPCVLKCAHSRSSKAVFILKTADEYRKATDLIEHRELKVDTLLTKAVDNLAANYCCYIYLSKSGSINWLGVVNQYMDRNGLFHSATGDIRLSSQALLEHLMLPTIKPVADALHQNGYFGIVGVDILVDENGDHYVIDINPRVCATMPSIMISPLMRNRGWSSFVYKQRGKYYGCVKDLTAEADRYTDVSVLILAVSVAEDDLFCMFNATIFGDSISRCKQIMDLIMRVQS